MERTSLNRLNIVMGSRLDTVTDWPGFAKEHGYRLGTMAHALGVSDRWLRVHLKRRFGATPRQWLAHWRFGQIQRLAGAGAAGDAIAQKVGFANFANLCRNLKAGFSTGVSQLRRQSE